MNLIGLIRIGTQPEITTQTSGKRIAKFVGYAIGSGKGENQVGTSFNFVGWDAQAGRVEKLNVGDLVFVNAWPTTRTWTPEGTDQVRYLTDWVLNSSTFCRSTEAAETASGNARTDLPDPPA